jgi:2-C-methyl-D-erythritol 4-phosphate cytidylyltransferase
MVIQSSRYGGYTVVSNVFGVKRVCEGKTRAEAVRNMIAMLKEAGVLID